MKTNIKDFFFLINIFIQVKEIVKVAIISTLILAIFSILFKDYMFLIILLFNYFFIISIVVYTWFKKAKPMMKCVSHYMNLRNKYRWMIDRFEGVD